MTAPQIGIFLLLGVMLIGFALGRFRYELVALSGLAAGVLFGFVPTGAVFAGWSNPTVITVIEILLIVQALGNSQVIGGASKALEWLGNDRRRIVLSLCGLGAFLSAFMNNIGALALVMPLAVSATQRYSVTLREILMPLSFATLLGGLGTVVGTPANLIGSELIAATRGYPVGFFEIGAIGVPLTLAGLGYIFLTTASGRADAVATERQNAEDTRLVVMEARPPAGSVLIGKSIEALHAEHRITVHNIVRDNRFVFGDASRIVMVGDVLVMTAPRQVAAQAVASRMLALPGALRSPPDTVRIDAVVLPDSIYVGSPVENLFAGQTGIVVQAVGITSRRIEGRLADVQLAVGDVLAIRGASAAIEEECTESGLLQVATVPQQVEQKTDLVPVAVFVAGIVATAVVGVEPALAFGAVVLVLALLGRLSIRRGLESMHWPSIIMLASMIPLGSAVATTGAATALADLILVAVPESSGMMLTAVMLLLAVLLTPFVNNPSTVLILAPIGIAVAERYGVPTEPVIVAITVGASLDLMTPFGHHNNTLVMGVAGYSFLDFLRRGAPLVLLSVCVTLACLQFL